MDSISHLHVFMEALRDPFLMSSKIQFKNKNTILVNRHGLCTGELLSISGFPTRNQVLAQVCAAMQLNWPHHLAPMNSGFASDMQYSDADSPFKR